MSAEAVARALFRAEINATVWPLIGGSIRISDQTLGTYTHNVNQVIAALKSEGFRIVKVRPAQDRASEELTPIGCEIAYVDLTEEL